ncbi:hypothetical protein HBI52_103150 [Parastagonospora nodorum]|nr:hypothetical protein HBI52_103150 [Parastagonospora nodorum]KAH6095670.1 hypothetical protein HBI65_107440 [Parastagonospora nodorum]
MSSDPKPTNRYRALPSRGEFFMTGVQPIYPLPDENCSICADALEENVVEIIMCQHSFHTMCILTWLSATDGMRNRACPNCRICLFDPSNPGPYIAPDPRPGLELEPPRIMGPRETYIQEQRQRVAERRAAELQHVPAPRLNAIVRELGSPISQREYELQTRQVVEEREAAEQLLAAPNNTVPDQPNPDINAAYDQERLEAEAAEIPASVAQPESSARGPPNRRTQASLEPARQRAVRRLRAGRGPDNPIIAPRDTPRPVRRRATRRSRADSVDTPAIAPSNNSRDDVLAAVPVPSRELDSRELRLVRRARRREEADAVAVLRRRG